MKVTSTHMWVGLLLLAAGCADQSQTENVLGPQASVSGNVTISGRILGADGTSICNTVPGARLNVRWLNPANPALIANPNATIFCPANFYSITAPAGTYQPLITVVNPFVLASGDYPRRQLEPIVTYAGHGNTDFSFSRGSKLQGGAYVEGNPVGGLDLYTVLDPYRRFLGTALVSQADGSWGEPFGRPSAFLQIGGNFYHFGCSFLGATMDETSFVGAFSFPARNRIDCSGSLSESTRFSHDHTQLVITPGPGEFGGIHGNVANEFGSGWGVQYPVAAPNRPLHTPLQASHMFAGGLIVAVEDRVLSAIDLRGYFECADGSCQDFGANDARVSTTASTPGGRKVQWMYSDAGSSEAVGLNVVQTSFDGAAPHDYVLFRYQFNNKSHRSLTFYVGVFMDWDVDRDYYEAGRSAMNDQLMYFEGPAGTRMGSLFLGNHQTAGKYFFRNVRGFVPLATQLAALRGDIVATTVPRADNRYIQSVGPITVRKGHKEDVWFAIVGGRTDAEIEANAAAAQADLQHHARSAGAAIFGAGRGVANISSARRAPDPACKAGCDE